MPRTTLENEAVEAEVYTSLLPRGKIGARLADVPRSSTIVYIERDPQDVILN
jgi:hypothetical protein